MTASVCAGCGFNDWDVDNYERVCTNCGDVQSNYTSEHMLCAAPSHEEELESKKNKDYLAKERLTGRIRGETQSADSKKSVNLEKKLDELQVKVKQLIKDANAVDETMNLVGKAIKGCKKRLFSEKKLGLAGACIYYVSSKYKLGLSLKSICKGLGIRLKVISACLKQVKEICPDYDFERPNIKDLASKLIDELASKKCDITLLNIAQQQHNNNQEPQASASSSSVTNNNPHESANHISFIAPEDKQVLHNRVLLLVDLFEATHPFNQPNPHTLIIAVIYHAWRSLDTFKMIAGDFTSNKTTPEDNDEIKTQKADEQSHVEQCSNTNQWCREKHLIGFEKFCSLFGIKYSSNGYKVVRDLQKSLLTLGRRIGNVTRLNLPWYLNDIIDNSSHLIKEQQLQSVEEDLAS